MWWRVGLKDSSAADEDATSSGEVDEASRQLDRISEKLQPVASDTATLSTVFVSLVAWVGVVTVLLAVVIIVTYRRYRHRHNASRLSVHLDDGGSVDSISSCSVPLTR